MTLLLTALILLEVAPTRYPIEPRTLRTLYRDAELVVVAKPGAITAVPKRKDSWVDSKVVLTVERIVKGKPREKEVTVYSAQKVECPSPARFPEGKTLLLFLKWSKRLRGYCTSGLSYGAKELDEPSLEVYLRRLEELSKIPAEPPGAGPSPWTLDWLVRCIEHPATRWEGAWEFQAVDRYDEPKRPNPLCGRLSKAQLERIIDVLTTSTIFDLDEYYVLQIFKDLPHHRFDVYLATELRYRCANGDFEWSSEMIAMLAERLNIPEGPKVLEELRVADDDADVRRAVEKFLELVELK